MKAKLLSISVLIFLLSTAVLSARAQTLVTLYAFNGGTDGGAPYAGVISDGKGNLYGTTSTAGVYGMGTAFKLNKNGLTVLHSFGSGDDGSTPYGGLVRDSEGNLYGTTLGGGSVGGGTVFEITPTGQEKVLHSFTQSEGWSPVDGLLRDRGGNLFGTLQIGGNLQGMCNFQGCGTVFWLNPSNQERSVAFDGTDGSIPYGALIEDNQGNFFGTTTAGGSAGCGTVFKVDRTGRLTVLHSFLGGLDGQNPDKGLVEDSAGNLYGTTYSGGSAGWGTIFKLDPSGVKSTLYNFQGSPDGALPDAALVLDAAGNLYGTTVSGGIVSGGAVFELTKAGTEIVLHSFEFSDGWSPYSSLFRDSSGNLYGTAAYGGGGSGLCYGYGCGTVFELKP